MCKQKEKGAFVACSDGLSKRAVPILENTKKAVEEMGIEVLESPYIYVRDGISGGTPKERAKILMEYYKHSMIRWIFDVSGGNLANQVLPYLDYEEIKKSQAEFWGYSDLTVLLNGIYTKTGKTSWLYQIRNLAGSYGEEQKKRFASHLLWEQGKKEIENELLPKQWETITGTTAEGILIGGNIRCFLKLAGTEYMPQLAGKILFLESMGGGEGVITSLLMQLSLLQDFDKLSAILLGTFTQLDEEEGSQKIEELVAAIAKKNQIPIMRTRQVGHGKDACALPIGKNVQIYEKNGKINVKIM